MDDRPRGKLRVAIRTDGVNRSLLYRDREDYPFRTLLTTDFRESVSPLFFTFDNKKLYVASNLGRNTSAIFVFDPEKAENEELIFEHPEVDVYALFRSKKRKVITGTGTPPTGSGTISSTKSGRNSRRNSSPGSPGTWSP